nr:CDP-glycerol glycerophosphotransferase family protein [Nocardioides lijunqiniae]
MRVVWNSFHGRFSDSPRALWERLAGRDGLEHVWLAHEAHLGSFPRAVRTVDIEGPGARQALESADLLVANTHTEVEWDKQPGTTYVQTWHGTPLKRVHRDVRWAPDGVLDRLDRDVDRWDLLLSQSAWSTPRLRSAFRWDGEVLESGYPRNDLLSRPESKTVRADVRRGLGIADDAVVVLYTPTWRDDEKDQGSELTYPLDPAELVRGLGPGHVLLVRAHYLLTGRLRLDALPGVHDVSLYPDLRDLYCAADVLVTDYSSAMFDFAVTGRPVLHLAPDLARFGDTVRGFYADLEEVAPGPVVSTTGELVDVLTDLATLEQDWALRSAAFRETFTPLDDGDAGERVLARLGLSG